MVRPQSHSLLLDFNPPESAYQPDSPVDYVHQSRPCPQVDSVPVVSPQSSNCSDNGNNVPTENQDKYLDTQTDVLMVLAENISDYDYYDNHSQPSLDDENTHCHNSDYQHVYHPNHSYLIDHSDLDSSWNIDPDSWFSLENSPGHPPVSQEDENPPTKAHPHEAMAEEQSLVSQLTESQVVITKELARLQLELQSVQDTLADECNHFSLVSQTYELELQAVQLALAPKQKQFPPTTQFKEELQAVNAPSCSPTQAHQDELAASTDIPKLQEYSFHSQSLSDISAEGSYTSPDSLPYPSVDCIQECLDTPVPDGILQNLALPRLKPKPWLSLKKNVPPQPDVPRPQPKHKLSLKKIGKVHTSPDAISHEDLPVHSTASGDAYDSKCTPTLSDSDSDEVETCIPSPTASPDLNDVTACSLEVSEALSQVESALSHAYAVLEHSLTCHIKLHPPD